MTPRPEAPDVVVRRLGWRDPLAAVSGLVDRDGLVCLLSDGGAQGRWSYVACEPDRVEVVERSETDQFRRLTDPDMQRGMIGLAAYDPGAEPAVGRRDSGWPDLMLARYPAMLVFDHHEEMVQAVGLGPQAAAWAQRAEDWLAAEAIPDSPLAPAQSFCAETPAQAYRAAVADVVDRIAAGELFQANIARAWSGELKADAAPFDVFLRLAQGRRAPFGAYWRLGQRALVSNSPELFVTFDPVSRRLETRPIKGTRGRDPDPIKDRALARALTESAKDRAENLMIVDLMRNDLARVSTPGSVRVERLFEIESHPTVHHLVSSVTATAAPGVGAAEILAATFPPGSITGAPKYQAMKVIASHEPPRGPWCGSLFRLDEAGGLTASVLIRTASFQFSEGRWSYRTLAGAGIVADSQPDSELEETGIKISALAEALTGDLNSWRRE